MEGTTNSEPQPLTLCKVFSETRRIGKSQRRSLNVLALLFLFPSSLAAVLCPLLFKSLSSAASKTFLFGVALSSNHGEEPTLPIPIKILVAVAVACFLFSLVLTLCAVASVTYTAFHGFNGEPIKLKTAIKSISAAFFPLLATALLMQMIIFAATFILAGAIILGFTNDNPIISSSPYLLGFITAMFIVLLMYFQVNWTLAYPVVVAESSWGFEPLRRSKALIKGKRGLALSLALIFGVYYFIYTWSNSYTAHFAARLGGASRPATAAEWGKLFLDFAAQFLCPAAMLTLMQLTNLIANTVLYVYCKAVNHGGGCEFSGDYFSLPVGDEKVASVV